MAAFRGGIGKNLGERSVGIHREMFRIAPLPFFTIVFCKDHGRSTVPFEVKVEHPVKPLDVELEEGTGQIPVFADNLLFSGCRGLVSPGAVKSG
jgi:hypothetical protein